MPNPATPLITAIKAMASPDPLDEDFVNLGFKDDKSIYSYPLEQVLNSKRSNYLTSIVIRGIQELKETRAISVYSTFQDFPSVTNRYWERTWNTNIDFYYPFGESYYQELIDAVDKVMKRIHQCTLGWSINKSFSTLIGLNILYSVESVGIDNKDGLINRATIQITGISKNI